MQHISQRHCSMLSFALMLGEAHNQNGQMDIRWFISLAGGFKWFFLMFNPTWGRFPF